MQFTPALPLSWIVSGRDPDRQSMLISILPNAGWTVRLHLVFPGVCGDPGGDDPPIVSETGIRDGTSFRYPESIEASAVFLETLATFVVGASCGEMPAAVRTQLADVGFPFQQVAAESRLVLFATHILLFIIPLVSISSLTSRYTTVGAQDLCIGIMHFPFLQVNFL